MDRQIVYPGQIPLETDLLNTNRYSMIATGKLAEMILGSGTLLNGLACTQTSVPSLQVQVAPGEIYSKQYIDATAYSSLAADTTHQIIKQGLSLDTTLLTITPPVTSGQSINYLVQITYQDTDGDSEVLPYYNSSNPDLAWSGPNNTGASQYTTRKGQCVIALKAGIAAATGSQVTPAPDSGYVGAWVITVANGATGITNSNISEYPGAPFFVGFASSSSLASYAPLASPAFTGAPTAPTQSSSDNSTKLATTAFAQLLQASGTLANPGYVRFKTQSGHDFVFQWGLYSLSASAGSSQSVTFPLPFTGGYITSWCGVDNAADQQIGTTGASLTGMTVQKGVTDSYARTGTWFALGYM